MDKVKIEEIKQNSVLDFNEFYHQNCIFDKELFNPQEIITKNSLNLSSEKKLNEGVYHQPKPIMFSSKITVVYRLPGIGRLVKMSPLEFLNECFIKKTTVKDKRIRALFEENKFIGSFLYSNSSKDIIKRDDVLNAIVKLHDNMVTEEDANSMLNFLGLHQTDELKWREAIKTKIFDIKRKLDFSIDEFEALCFFSERFFIWKNLPVLSHPSIDNSFEQDFDFIQKVDFECLITKLDYLEENPFMIKLIKFLAKQSNI